MIFCLKTQSSPKRNLFLEIVSLSESSKMSSAVSLEHGRCCCTCHSNLVASSCKTLPFPASHRELGGRNSQRKSYLIEWEEFLDKFSSNISEARTSSTSTSTFDSDADDDVMPDEEDQSHFRLRMLQRQGWNGTGKLKWNFRFNSIMLRGK